MKDSEIVYGLGYFDWGEIGRAEGYARHIVTGKQIGRAHV